MYAVDRDDVVRSVAALAAGSELVSAGQGLAMEAPLKCLFRVAVTAGAFDRGEALRVRDFGSLEVRVAGSAGKAGMHRFGEFFPFHIEAVRFTVTLGLEIRLSVAGKACLSSL